jgi:(2S)-methylsuccinyl-CoA dehydrogenase
MGAELITQLETAAAAAGAYAEAAKAAVLPLVSKSGKLDRVALDPRRCVKCAIGRVR